MINFIVTFDVLESYHADFGFDWVNYKPNSDGNDVCCVQKDNLAHFEYMYDEEQNTYINVKGERFFQEVMLLYEYKTFKINDSDSYYIPYLSIFPDQEIELQMVFTMINDTDITTACISFENNDAYLVTVDGKTNENIKYIPDGHPKEITIKCIKPSEETHIIAKDEENNIVGKICVKDNRTIHHLDVRIVCIVEDTPQKDAEIDQLIEEFKTNRIEEHLNQNSLNQALIKTKVEIDKKYHIALNEEEITDVFACLKDQTKTNHNETLFNRLSDEYQRRFGGDEAFKGILIFLNRSDINDIGGTTREVSVKEIIMFRGGLSSKVIYAHEIGHALGLEHSFICPIEVDYAVRISEQFKGINDRVAEIDDEIDASTNSINKNTRIATRANTKKTEMTSYIDEYKSDMDTFELFEMTKKIDALSAQIEEVRQSNAEFQKEIDTAKQERAAYEKSLMYIENMLGRFKKNKYKFAYGSTYNLMDYSAEKYTLTHWQWQIMQDNINHANQNIS